MVGSTLNSKVCTQNITNSLYQRKIIEQGFPPFSSSPPPPLLPKPRTVRCNKKKQRGDGSPYPKGTNPLFEKSFCSVTLPVKFAAVLSLSFGFFLALQEFIMIVKADCVVEVVFLLWVGQTNIFVSIYSKSYIF